MRVSEGIVTFLKIESAEIKRGIYAEKHNNTKAESNEDILLSITI
jgi:hypothetical protein